MLYKEVITSLNEFLSSNIISKDFGDVVVDEAFNDDVPTISKENVDLPKDGIGHKNGVYIIYTTFGEVYYIGKATQNNIHEEVWGKIKTPSENDDSTSFYPKNYFLNKNNLG